MKRAIKKQAPAAPAPRPFLGEWKCDGYVRETRVEADSLRPVRGFARLDIVFGQTFTRGVWMPMPHGLDQIVESGMKLEITVRAFV